MTSPEDVLKWAVTGPAAEGFRRVTEVLYMISTGAALAEEDVKEEDREATSDCTMVSRPPWTVKSALFFSSLNLSCSEEGRGELVGSDGLKPGGAPAAAAARAVDEGFAEVPESIARMMDPLEEFLSRL